MFYNVSTDTLVTIFLFFCVLSPVFTLLLAFLTNSILRFNINNLKRNSTPEQFQEYMDKYNWKYSVEFFFPQMKRDLSGPGSGRHLTYSPIYFTQVSESDAGFFKDWLSWKDGSFLELKDFTDKFTKVNRKYMSLTRVRLEAVPRKLRTKVLYAIYEKDGTLIYSFEEKQMENEIKNISKLWLIPLICSLAIPATRGLTIFFVIDYFIWTSYNMSYLLKKYPLCRVSKLTKTQNANFFKK